MPNLNSARKVREAPLEEVLRVLAAENKKRRENRTALHWSLGIGVAILVLAQIVLWARGRGMMDFTSFGSLIVVFGCGMAFTSTHKAALERLQELVSRESVGFLIEAYGTTSEKDIAEVCERALLRALPLVESEDDFDDFQRGLLYRTLKKTRSSELAEAILDTVHRIGGSEAIPFLEEFRTEAGRRKGTDWERLSTRSLSVLPDLRIRVARAIIEQRVQEDQELRLQ